MTSSTSEERLCTVLRISARSQRGTIGNDIPQVTLWRLLQKHLHLKAYKLTIAQAVERWTFSTHLSVNVFVTLASEQRLEYNCKVLFETPCTLESLSTAERWNGGKCRVKQ
jgi:hypothetical protein